MHLSCIYDLVIIVHVVMATGEFQFKLNLNGLVLMRSMETLSLVHNARDYSAI